ncbi:MAG: hypothetical protein IPL55_14730 [Saprospiraceae bacterium]|jgi:uncharacterized protein (TIGR02646 family)|nr:hypothetical protein [Saprospiraceae bacterium]
MTLVEIDLSKEPVCLQELQATLERTYENLEGECKEEVITLLKISQNNLCAYCQKSIESVMTIEHYIAQSDAENNGHHLQLYFSNFLGVCLGQFRYDRLSRKTILHCDSSRGNIPLKIDPRINGHINTISYTDHATIESSDPDFNTDLNNVLNLNMDGICYLRQKGYNEYLTFLSTVSPEMNPLTLYQKSLRDMEQNPPEYYGYIKFRLEKLIERVLG